MSSGAANFLDWGLPHLLLFPQHGAFKSETVLEIGHFDRGFCVISSPLEAFLIDLIVW